MNLIADILLGAGAIAAAAYCMVLARRLARFSQLEGGMGGAIAVLSAQVDDMTSALSRARKAAGDSSTALESLNTRAEATAARLEIILASMHDLPVAGAIDATRNQARQLQGRTRLRVVRRRSGEAA